MNILDLQDWARRDNVTFVPMDEYYSLVDSVGENVLVINASAAWVWSHLSTAEVVPTQHVDAVQALVGELEALGLVVKAGDSTAIEPVGQLNDAPQIVAASKLQVAANNSGAIADPFA